MIRVVRIARHETHMGSHVHINRISLPAEPFDIPPGGDETAPRSAPIRGQRDWRKDDTLRGASKAESGRVNKSRSARGREHDFVEWVKR